MRLMTMGVLMVAALGAGGCNILAYPLYLIAPKPPAKTVEAEFDQLNDKSVAVLVYADMEILCDYENVREQLATAVNHQLSEHVSGVRPLNALTVVRYQWGHPECESQDPAEVGRALGVDYVLYVSLKEFVAGGPGYSHLTKARISAAVSAHDTRPVLTGMRACRWRKDDLTVEEGDGAGALTAGRRALRQATVKRFATALVRSFYDHKAPAES